jgi:hypothetical protein
VEGALFVATEASIQAPKTGFEEGYDQVSYMWRYDVHEH